MKAESFVIRLSWWRTSLSQTKKNSWSFPRDGAGIACDTYWMAGWLIEKQERRSCNTGFSVSTEKLPHFHPPLPHSIRFFNMAPLYISPWQLHCAWMCACVCEVNLTAPQPALKARSHGFWISSEWRARPWKQWSHWTQRWQGGSGREDIRPSICAEKRGKVWRCGL